MNPDSSLNAAASLFSFYSSVKSWRILILAADTIPTLNPEPLPHPLQALCCRLSAAIKASNVTHGCMTNRAVQWRIEGVICQDDSERRADE